MIASIFSDHDFLAFMPPETNSDNNNQFTTFRLSSLNEIKCIIDDMADYTKGCDELPAMLFKSNFDILGDTIFDVCNCSLVRGTFPDALMITKIVCLF